VDDVVDQHDKRDALGSQQLEEISRVCARQNYPADEIAALHHLWQVQIFPRYVWGVVEGEKEQIPPVGAAIGLSPEQDRRMKRVHHCPIAEKKDQRSALIALGQIDIELRGGIQDSLLDVRRDSCIAV